MPKVPKSFRFEENDLKKLGKVHEWYMNQYKNSVADMNMYNLYKWSEAQTIAVLIRDKYEELVNEKQIDKIEN